MEKIGKIIHNEYYYDHPKKDLFIYFYFFVE